MKNQSGYIAILTVIIVMAIVIVTLSTVTFLAIGEGQSGLAFTQGEMTLNLIEGCAEEVLVKSQNNPDFGNTSPINLIHPEGTCVVSIDKTTVPWVMTVTTDSTSLYQRTIQITYTWNISGITLAGWKEL